MNPNGNAAMPHGADGSTSLPPDCINPASGKAPTPGEVGAKALEYEAGGLSVIQIRTDGTKRPVGTWGAAQTVRATAAQLTEQFSRGPLGIGIVCGAISRNLEVLDYDAPGAYDEWLQAVDDNGLRALVDTLPLVASPGEGGRHVYYRYLGPALAGRKLAKLADGKSVKIETRGEGHYIIAPGSHPATHPTGRPYTLIHGDLSNIPVITSSERNALVGLAELLTEYVEEPLPASAEKTKDRTFAGDDGTRPGDDFNQRGDVEELLTEAGWKKAGDWSGGSCWTRPGKKKGTSATWNYRGSRHFKVFTTSSAVEADRAYDAFGLYAALKHGGNLQDAAKALYAEGFGARHTPATLEGAAACDAKTGEELEEDDENTAGAKPADSQATKLWRMVQDMKGVELFHTPNDEPFITLPVNGKGGPRRETCRLSAGRVSAWMRRRYAERYHTTPGSKAVQDAVHQLEATALFDGAEHQVHLRTAWHDGAIYVDLGDTSWRAIKVTAEGWTLVSDSPVKFRRSAGMLPLPIPRRGGSLTELRALVNVLNDDSLILLIGWLAMALHPDGPYPVLCLSGPQGTGKSTATRIIRSLVDPNKAPLRSEPKDAQNLAVAADNSWVIALDNLSGLPGWLSDGLCRLSTGGGFASRKLYTDGDEVIMDAKRPVILTGINVPMTREDLIDRTILLPLAAIPDSLRRTETDILKAAEIAGPRLFGAILGSMSTALRNLSTTKISGLPRMADFALWATAGETAYGKPGAFMAAYGHNLDAAAVLALESSDVATALVGFIAMQPGGAWSGYSEDLLRALNAHVGESKTRDKWWPKDARGLSQKLNRAESTLRSAGIIIKVRELHGRTWRDITSIEAGAPGGQDVESGGQSDDEGGKSESLAPLEDGQQHAQSDGDPQIGGAKGQNPQPFPFLFPIEEEEEEEGEEEGSGEGGGILPSCPPATLDDDGDGRVREYI